jgi:hypothetical protein
MDPLYMLNQRLRYFSECLHGTPAANIAAPSVEDWLQYWNDDDTDLANLRNFEHWLSTSKAQRELRHSR